MSPRSRLNRALSSAEWYADDVHSRASDAAGRAEAHYASLKDAVASSATQFANAITARLETAGVDTDALYSNAGRQARRAQSLLEDKVRERPLRAVGIALAIGAVVAMITAR